MSQPQRLKRGAPVPYRLLAGVEPCGRGCWLVVSGKLQGVSLFPELPQLLGTLIEILDYRPPFEIVALHAPIGLPSALHPGGRASDRAARRLLGPRCGGHHLAAVPLGPRRRGRYGPERGGAHAAARIGEVQRDVASYHQRTVFEVHPELGFHQLNGDGPLRRSKRTRAGIEERPALLQARMPGL